MTSLQPGRTDAAERAALRNSVAAEPGWRLRHLPPLLASAAAAALFAGAAGALAGGPPAAAGAVLGVAVAAGSFTLTTVALAWLDRVARPLILPAGLLLYVVKFVVVAMLVWQVARDGRLPVLAVALGITAGAFAWISAHIAWLQTRRGRPRL